MDRKEKILAYIQSKEYIPLRIDELKAVLDVPSEDMPELSALLEELCGEGKIYKTKKKRYIAAGAKSSVMAGRLRCGAKGYFGFVTCDDEKEEDIFVEGDFLGSALSGDRVLVQLDNAASRSGHIVKVLSRASSTFVGVIYKQTEDIYYLRPDDSRIYANIRIKAADAMGASKGTRAAAEITEYNEAEGKFYGRVIFVLGDAQSVKSCTDGIVIGSGISYKFSSEVMRCADNISDKIGSVELEGRTDLRDWLIFTIDGDDARDFDDAVSLSVLENGNYYLGVHIADVSHYVTPGSPIDNEAYKRGTSVYLADRVIPMLPEKLSNGICSLNPNEDRLTLSVFMEIDMSGEIVRHAIEKSVIRSKERMTYNNVTKLLEERDGDLCERYKNLLPVLRKMRDLAEILYKKRENRGAIQFDFPETYIAVDERGEPVEISKAERGMSNRIIEEFMLCANETVAEYAFWSELPFIYRVHNQPSVDKIQEFNEFIRNFGLTVHEGRDGIIHPKALQQVLDAVKDTPEERMVSSKMLRSLMKAEYKTENTGHFGLAAKYYCHFTSPIRRYPDLVVHRLLKELIEGREPYKRDFSDEALQSSECEITAEHIERDAEDLMKTAYMSHFIGKAFDGVIANITRYGMFVELENSIEGLVRVENMSGDYYEYDSVSSSLIGNRNGERYKIGDIIRVAAVNADVLTRQIDFVLERDMNRDMIKRFAHREEPIIKKAARSRKRSNINRKKFIRTKHRHRKNSGHH